MRIGLFTDTFPPEINGVANSTNILRNTLVDHGHTVFVVCTGLNKTPKWEDNGHVLRIPGIVLPFLYGYVMSSPFQKKLLRTIADLNLDIIHVQTEFGVGLFAHTCAKKLNIPLVNTYHTTWEDYTHYVNPLHSKLFEKGARKGVAYFSRKVTDAVEEIITPSAKTKSMLENYGITKPINIIPTGLNLKKFSADLRTPEARLAMRKEFGYEENDRILLYVGRLAEEKGLDMVIGGVAKAVRAGVDIRLLIVGGGPDLERLRGIVEKENLQDCIQLTGPIPSDRVPAIYAFCDAFISASLSETQGMTFIEALASGLPLFARHDDVLDDLLEEGVTGWFFESEDELKTLLTVFAVRSREELEEMQEDCLEKVIPYTSDIFGDRVISVYERVLKGYKKAE
ncbi:MAG: glycosyltransferase family 4 protein [Erysipelotrichaceae bacterium]|nr:glycosyltransferase family 4 protein [Erysipelotrichaceae bacterium]